MTQLNLFTNPRLLVIVLALLMSGTGRAESVEPIKLQGVSYYSVQYYKFKSGTHYRAEEIVRSVFLKANREAGGKSFAVVMMTGPWDLLVYHPLPGGTQDLEYVVSPQDAEWISKMTEILGDSESVRAIIDEFDGLIEREAAEIGRTPMGMPVKWD